MSTTDDEPEVNGKSDTPDTTDAGADAPDHTDAPVEAEADAPAASKPSRLEAQRAAREADRATRTQASGGWLRSAKRYGPFVAVAIIVVGAIAIFSGGDDSGDDDDAATSGDGAAFDEDELVRSGPMTPARAELEGVDVDFGPTCDTELGRVAIPTMYSAPCVEPFDGDNGGATSPGVTADEIVVVRYETDPDVDPVGTALVRATGVDVNPNTAFETVHDYAGIFAEYYETYGREVRIVDYLGSGASDDEEAARADAVEIADMEPFAVIGGPLQSSSVFGAELASRGVVCIGPCANSLPDAVTSEHEPHMWQTGPSPDQAANMAGELIGNLAGPGKAELAGDPATQAKDRRYALVHYNTEDGTHTAVAEALTDALADNGVDVTTDIEFVLDPATIQEDARTHIARLEADGVTTVIFYGDPLMPKALTEEATAQDYHPEWILGPALYADTAVFARSFDQAQWANGFGIGLTSLRGEDATSDSWGLHDWAYGTEPANNAYAAILPPVRHLFQGIHLAGPELTPETFRDGMFRYPSSGGYPSRPQFSWGFHGVWGDDAPDFGGSEDAAVIWWDPGASGTDETGQEGDGLYRFANGGERYTLGNFPESAEDAGLFVDADSLTIVDELPPEAEFDYPAPDLGS